MGDLPDIGRLHVRGSESQGRLDPRLAPAPGNGERFTNALRSMHGSVSGVALVAEGSNGEGIVGFATGKIMDNAPFASPEFGHVGCLYVDEGLRGEGTGHKLVTAVNDEFRDQGVNVAQVDVCHLNLPLKRFWEDRGFTRFLDHLYYEAGSELAEDEDPAVAIRQARARDQDAVLSLWAEMMDYHAPIDERLRIAGNWRRYVARATRQWMSSAGTRLLVAEVGEKVVGFAVGGLVDIRLGVKPGLHGHIAHMCVNEQWRRQGVGSRLFASFRDSFRERGVSSIHVYVSPFNSVSQLLWRSLGFGDYIERLWCDLT